MHTGFVCIGFIDFIFVGLGLAKVALGGGNFITAPGGEVAACSFLSLAWLGCARIRQFAWQPYLLCRLLPKNSTPRADNGLKASLREMMLAILNRRWMGLSFAFVGLFDLVPEAC